MPIHFTIHILYALFHFSFSSQNIAYVGRHVYVGLIKHRMHSQSLWLSSQMGMNTKIGFLTIILKDSSIIHCIWFGSGEKEKNESDEWREKKVKRKKEK